MLKACVKSFVDGRIRLRHPALCSPDNAALLLEMINAVDGVRSTTLNPVTGSLLLEYDPSVLDLQTLLDMAAPLETFVGSHVKQNSSLDMQPKESQNGRKSPAGSCSRGFLQRGKRRPLNLGMLFTLGTSMAFALAGRMTGHVAWGLAFLALGSVHIGIHRKSL